ncbi:MAG: hypothetical protein WC712_13305 [Candidatus Brocadiia bacterium]
MRQNSECRGTVLIVVAGLLAALAIIGFTFLMSVSSRQSETRYYYQLEQARQAASSGVEYCFGAVSYVSTSAGTYDDPNNPMTGIEAPDVNAAVTIASGRIFNNPSDYSFYNLECHGVGDFVHDAFNTDPNTQAILRGYGGTVDPEILVKIDPVAALYSCNASTLSIPVGSLADPGGLMPGETRPLTGDATVNDFKVYGWGRVFSRSLKSGSTTEYDYLPICEEASTATFKLYFKGQVSIPDIADPTRKVYDFKIDKVRFTDRQRMIISDLPAALTGNGKTWFLP